MSAVTQIDPAGLKAKMDAHESFCLLDVREKELDANSAIIVMCKSGGRSQRAAEFLASRGYRNVSNLAGGIDAWSRDVDPGVPEY